MSSQKPYLIRAVYEWCNDNNFTPYLATVVDAQTMVPLEYVEDKKIVLNLASGATKDLLIDNDWITCKATFGGITRDLAIPVANVLALFAKENGQGMQFQIEIPEAGSTQTSPSTAVVGGLKLVK